MDAYGYGHLIANYFRKVFKKEKKINNFFFTGFLFFIKQYQLNTLVNNCTNLLCLCSSKKYIYIVFVCFPLYVYTI